MRPIILLSAVVLSLSSVAAQAADAAAGTTRAPRAGEVVRDSKQRVLGRVHDVTADGTTLVVFSGRVVRLPANTLSIVDDKLVTSLTKSEALKLK